MSRQDTQTPRRRWPESHRARLPRRSHVEWDGLLRAWAVFFGDGGARAPRCHLCSRAHERLT